MRIIPKLLSLAVSGQHGLRESPSSSERFPGDRGADQDPDRIFLELPKRFPGVSRRKQLKSAASDEDLFEWLRRRKIHQKRQFKFFVRSNQDGRQRSFRRFRSELLLLPEVRSGSAQGRCRRAMRTPLAVSLRQPEMHSIDSEDLQLRARRENLQLHQRHARHY